MKELRDYSGDYVPDLRLTDFSSETLDEILKLHGKIYLALDGFWYLAVKELVSNEVGFECDMRAWEKVCKHEMEVITRQLNIQGNDVLALVKALQITSWIQTMEFKIEVKDNNNAILTITRCPILDGLEKEGEGREKDICNVAGLTIFQNYASFFNPDIAVRGLTVAPRKSKDEICCQWEFKLEGHVK